MRTATAVLATMLLYGCALFPFRSNYVHLFISNQSLDMSAANVVVKMDGKVVFEGEANVKDQHNWIRLMVKGLKDGSHLIEVEEKNTGTHQTKVINLSRDLWVVIDFWYLKGKPLAGPPRFRIQVYTEKVHLD